ncbi:MAG TPA: hypothetical protein VNG51_19285 [Ktedonobacteraceae bacterium]|nr:hypothetical protein [Ktedonobacteraceae bacterium]
MHRERIIREDTVSIKIELERVQKRLEHMQTVSMAEGQVQQPFSEEFKAEMAIALGGLATQLEVIHDTVFPPLAEQGTTPVPSE